MLSQNWASKRSDSTSSDNVESTNSEVTTGRTLRVDDTNVGQFGVVRQGQQRIFDKVLKGRCRGETIEAENLLRGDLEYDHLYQPGEKVLLVLNFNEQGKFDWAHPAGPYRLGGMITLATLFFLLLMAVCGWTGLKAGISFLFTAIVIWKILVPSFLAGWNPIPIAIAIVAILAGSIMVLVGGWNRKGFVAFCGCLGGLAITYIVSTCFAEPFHLHGAVRPFGKTLLTRFPELNITQIFLAGIFISASGAVMDLAMDIAAALEEIAQKNPELHRQELFRSGLRVGRSVVGTMTTTLLFAYSGGYLMAMMWFTAQGIQLELFLNTPFMAAETLNTLAGSFGLITVAPLTALAGALVYHQKRNPTSDT